MGLETGTYISDLVTTNPITTDLKNVGDDHLRLIKGVLRSTFPNASKPFYFPEAVSKTANYSVLATEQGKTFYIDTTAGAVVMTLPALGAGDGGWSCNFMKFNGGTNPYFIAPPSGVIISGEYLGGVARTRRCIVGRTCTAVWSGGAWFVSRAIGLPLNSTIQWGGTASVTLPVGFEWPNGQTLASASTNYPDFYAANNNSGVVMDKRGRATVGKDDMGGVSANRLTNLSGGINGDTLLGVGGQESVTLVQAQLPNVSLSVDIPAGQGSHSHPNSKPNSGTPVRNDLFHVNVWANSTNASTDNATLPGMSGSASLGGSDAAHNNVQPSIVMNELLVVE